MSLPFPDQQQLPATPTYILRGHAAPIHALQIFNQNLRLISGDANGWIAIWDLVFKRPVAVWKAHEGALLEVKGFNLGTGAVTEIYTHGRDHKLRVWRFRAQDEEFLQKTLPVDLSGEQQPDTTTAALSQPWLIHSLPVNALNFCAFSMLFINTRNATAAPATVEEDSSSGTVPPSSVLFAVPNALDSGAIDLFTLPAERRICTIPADKTVKTGMVMAAHLSQSSTNPGELYVAAAYEDGHVMVFGRRGPSLSEKDLSGGAGSGSGGISWKWEKLYACRSHTQPVLSIDAFPAADYFLSSSADAVLVKHPIPRFGSPGHFEDVPMKKVNTKHAGQQGLRVRPDGKIFATAGWDSRIRVYSCKTMKELAVLKWHKEGCYSVAFAGVISSSTTTTTLDSSTPLSTLGQGVEGGVPQPDVDQSGNGRQLTRHGNGEFSLAQVQRQRSHKVQNTHWLAAGSKDGKISLWDIY